MNDMADRLLRGGESDSPRLVREGGTFFKQFLPLSDTLKYDVVLSSRSLLELPDMTSRLKTIDVLWRKTSGYLIIVEAGTNAGYSIVQEARDYVLELSRRAQEEGDFNPEGYVFAPCAHDKLCPRFFDGSNIPCNFEVSYRPFSLERAKASDKDSFSYVVIRRGKRNESAEKQWPRLIQAPLIRKKHVVCRTCTQYGTLSELTVTKRKHSKECYRVCRHSQWGDLLPVHQPEEHLTQGPDSGNLHANDQGPDEATEVI